MNKGFKGKDSKCFLDTGLNTIGKKLKKEIYQLQVQE